MPITISTPDTLRHSIEAATGGTNTVLYDDRGYPSVMVVIPAFKMSDIDPSLPAAIHPAFIVNGAQKSEIFIGKFMGVEHNGRGLSLPDQPPATAVSWTQARSICESKGNGWHLMTNAEWAAIALLCWKRGVFPHGNTDWGRSHAAVLETARRLDGRLPGDNTQVTPPGAVSGAVTRTGTGPSAWSHDGTSSGVFDLVGNSFEWVGGVRLSAGEIQVIRDNDAANRLTDQGVASAAWRAISAGDALVAPGTAGTMKFDSPVAGSSAAGYSPAELSDQIRNLDDGPAFAYAVFKDLAPHAGVVAPSLLKQLALYPISAAGMAGTGNIYIRNFGERMCARGGQWNNGAAAGMFTVGLSAERSWLSAFRPAYVIL